MAATKKTLEEREEFLIAVERLMLQGIANASFIGRQLNISTPTVQEYQKAILKRWELTSEDGSETFSKMRAELIEKTRFMENKLWEKYNNSSNESAALGIARTIIDLYRYRGFLAGIPKVLDGKE